MKKNNKIDLRKYKPFGLVFGSKSYDEEGQRNIFLYFKSFYCQPNYIIHTSENQVLNCPHCSKIYFKS